MREGAASGGQAPAAFEYPQHWSKEDRALFDRVSDMDVRKAIFDRFGAMEKGYAPKLQEHARFSKRYGSVDAKFKSMIEGLETRGQTLEAYIGGVVALEQALQSKDPKTQAGAIKKLADLYGVDLRALMGGQAGGEQGGAPAPAVPREVLDEINGIKAHLSQQQQREAAQRVASLEKSITTMMDEKGADGQPTYPHFEEVIEDIIALVQAEQAAGRQVTPEALPKLYERAVWGRDDKRDELIKAKAAADERKRREDLAKKAKDAQRRSVSLPAHGSGGGDDDESLRDTIRSALRQAG